MTKMVSFGALIAIIVVIGLLFYKVMVGFFVPVFLAAVLCVVFRPLHRAVLERLGQREKTAAAVTTALILLSVLLPAGLIIAAAAVQGANLISDVNSASVSVALQRIRTSLSLNIENAQEIRKCQSDMDQLVTVTDESMPDSQRRERVDLVTARLDEDLGRFQEILAAKGGTQSELQIAKLKDLRDSLATLKEMSLEDPEFAAAILQAASKYKAFRIEIMGGTYYAWLREVANPTTEDVERLTREGFDFIRPRLLSFTGATGIALIKLIIGTGIMVLSIFFFLYDGPGMVQTLMKLSPLADRYEQELLLEFDRISRAIVLATILSALVQGLIAGIGYYFCGMPSLVLLILLTTVFALVPLFGPATVWVPVCLYLAVYEQRITEASLLAAWGVLVVGTSDNIVKALVLHGQSQLHPLLALMSVIGGVQALGPIGIVVGPMVVALLQTLLGILRRELSNMERNSNESEGDSKEDIPGSLASKIRRRGVNVDDIVGVTAGTGFAEGTDAGGVGMVTEIVGESASKKAGSSDSRRDEKELKPDSKIENHGGKSLKPEYRDLDDKST